MTATKEKASVFLAFLMASAILLLFLSTCSPLYPTNPWVDANCYVTVARGMRAGMLPYRDLIEQKGPLFYALHYLALLVSPNGFLGVYLLEAIAMALFLYASYRTLKLLNPAGRGIVPLLIGIAGMLAASAAFLYGDSAEEFCTPLLAWSMYEAVAYFSGKSRMKTSRLVCNGLLAGCVLWIKYSLLGLHFAWMAVIAIDCVMREKKALPALKMCLAFLAGMALSALPWLIYFGANGALGDLFRVYFYQNLTSYPTKRSFVMRLLTGAWHGACKNPMIVFLMAAALAGVVLNRRVNIKTKISVVSMMICTGIFAYSSGRGSVYMAYALACFAPLALCFPLRLSEKAEKWGRGCMLALAFCMLCVSFAGGNMISKIGFPREELPQKKFADVICQTENPKLLNCGFLDGGFYLAADVLPEEKWFCKLNITQDVCMEAQKRAIEREETDYVVTRVYKLPDMGIDDSLYDLVLQEDDGYAVLESREPFRYYLYRRKALRPQS